MFDLCAYNNFFFVFNFVSTEHAHEYIHAREIHGNDFVFHKTRYATMERLHNSGGFYSLLYVVA
jgi:hypothetical protein